MNTKMYVGNLAWSAAEQDIRELFAEFGSVTEVVLPEDKMSGRPRGFAFVSLDTREGMEQAIRQLDGREFLGRNLTVNEARPREERPNFGGGGGGGRSFGGGGGRSGGRQDRDRDRGGYSGGQRSRDRY